MTVPMTVLMTAHPPNRSLEPTPRHTHTPNSQLPSTSLELPRLPPPPPPKELTGSLGAAATLATALPPLLRSFLPLLTASSEPLQLSGAAVIYAILEQSGDVGDAAPRIAGALQKAMAGGALLSNTLAAMLEVSDANPSSHTPSPPPDPPLTPSDPP